LQVCSYYFYTIISIKKIATINCSVCKNEIDLNDLSDGTISKLAAENNNLKNPIWTFFGSFVIVCCLAYFAFNYFKTEDKTKLLINNPKIEDVYYMKDAKGYYYTFRIDSITKDRIYATVNDCEVDLPYEIEDIDVTENYTNKNVGYTKHEINQLFKENKIVSIKRN